MKYPVIILILILIYLTKAGASDIKVDFHTGIGFYNMATFSEITEEVKNSNSFHSKIISNYPPYLYYQPELKFSFANYELGFLYLYQTTGSRISSKDYSGEYSFDTKIHSHSPGIFVSCLLKDYGKIKLYLDIQAGGNFSKLTISEYLRVNNQASADEDQFTAMSLYIKPGFRLDYAWKQYNFGLNFGYFKEFLKENYSKVHARENEIEINTKFMDKDVWDGVRLGISVSYSLLYKKHHRSNASVGE